MSENLLIVPLILGPFVVFGIAGFWIAARLWWPLLARLDIPRRNRRVSRNLLFSGCMNGTPEIISELKRCRRAFAVLFSVFFVFSYFFFGFYAAMLFLTFFVVNFLTTRPHELPEIST